MPSQHSRNKQTAELRLNEKTQEQDGLKQPSVVTFSADFGTPVAIFHELSEHSQDGFLFESTEGDGRLARFSFLGVDPAFTVSIKNGLATVSRAGQEERHIVQNPVAFLQGLLARESVGIDTTCASLGELPFSGGMVGYMGYGCTSYLDKIKRQESDPFAVPDAHYGFYDAIVAFDHQYRRISVVSYRGETHALALMKRTMSHSGLIPLRLDSVSLNEEQLFAGVQTAMSQESYETAVKRARQYIHQGQAFQIVVAQRFSLKSEGEPIDLYRMLQATNPSPYAYYLKCPQFVYIGSSPETFVRCRNRQVMLRAIAGTSPRGIDAEQDERFASELRSNEKEMAEHRMLVDLGRNDLGRVSTPGSINIGELACLTRYTHVMHLATEISGRLAPDKTAFDAFESAFPAGTVSGAPKVRAMQLLQELEPEQRGIYSGAVGYFDLQGNMDGAIAIRSALVKDGMVHVNAGAGIVFDSDPHREYLETRNKAKSLLQAVKLAQLARATLDELPVVPVFGSQAQAGAVDACAGSNAGRVPKISAADAQEGEQR